MRRFALVSAAVSALLCACQNGTVTLSVADAPIDGATSAVIAFIGVDLVESNGNTHSFDFDTPVAPNLLGATTATALLTNVTVPAGDYDKIILRLSADGSGNDSSLTAPDSSSVSQKFPLELDSTVPDTGVTVDNLPFHVTRLRNTALTVDVDLRSSIRLPATTGDPLVLNPQVRLVNNEDVGTLTGSVVASVLTSNGCSTAAIYVYLGNVSTPDDVAGAGSRPVASATLATGSTGTTLVPYTVRYLDPGIYTVAVLCNSALDDPTTDDNVTFVSTTQQNVQVLAGQITTVPLFQ